MENRITPVIVANLAVAGFNHPFQPEPSLDPVAVLCGANSDSFNEQQVLKTVGPLLLKTVRKLENSLGIPGIRLD